MRQNFENFGQAQKLPNARKRLGRPRVIIPIMRKWLVRLLVLRNDLYEKELVSELWCAFEIVVHRTTVGRLLQEEDFSSKVNTRIAAQQDPIRQGIYLEDLHKLLLEGRQARGGDDPTEMLLYLDESAASEKVLFRRQS